MQKHYLYASHYNELFQRKREATEPTRGMFRRMQEHQIVHHVFMKYYLKTTLHRKWSFFFFLSVCSS